MRLSIRHWLLAVAIFGATSSAVSLFALGRIISVSANTRLERGREAVATEVERLATQRKDPGPTPPWKLIGIRGGALAQGERVDGIVPPLEPSFRRPLEEAVATASASGQRRFAEEKVDGGTMVVAAAPDGRGGWVWAGYMVTVPTYFRLWQWILATLTVATSLLVATSLVAVVSMRRGAETLRAALETLPHDLARPIPRPQVRELADVADGIASLAAKLLRAQDEQARLGKELAAQDRLAALGRVAAGVAHEVRNPLAAMKLRVDLASTSPGVPADVSRELSTVVAEIDRLDRLVADLLVVAGRRSGPRTDTALGELVASRAEQLSLWASELGVKLTVSGDAHATVDPDAVSRAVDNLIRNAVEASPKGGSVSVDVQDRADAACVRVIDRGPGVAEDRMHELFEPFFTTKSDGTGLGLAISRAIAHGQSGSLVYARENGATRFELTFPPNGRAGRAA